MTLEAIRASAGSGKTYQLTTRYLRALHQGISPEFILATTFTRKAAGEILGRVLERLAHAAADKSGHAATELGTALELGKLSQAQCRTLLVSLCRSLHRVSVSTLDSFFGSLLSGFILETEAPRDGLRVDDNSPIIKQIRLDSIHGVLSEISTDDFIELLNRLEHGDASTSITERIDDIVRELYNTFRSAPREAWHKLVPLAPLGPEIVGAGINRLRLAGVESKYSSHRKAIDKALNLASDQRWKLFLDETLTGKVRDGEAKFSNAVIAPAIHEAYEPLIAHAKSIVLKQLAEQTAATYELMEAYAERYAEGRRRRRVMLYSDIPLALANALANKTMQEIAHRLDYNLRHLLLDEFQDTDPVQWSILKPFAESIVAQGDGAGLFCVGDLKQSIYGWRGAAPQIFDQIGDDIPGLGWTALDTSHRSGQVVLDAVNDVFSTLENNVALSKYAAAAQQWQQRFHRHEAAAPTAKRAALPGYVELIESAQSAEGDEAETGGDHFSFVAKQVVALASLAPRATVGVLMRNNASVVTMISLLRSLGIEASGEGGAPIADDPGVELILSALTLADHPGDTASAFHIVNSPLAKLTGLRLVELGHMASVAGIIRGRLLDIGYGGVVREWALGLGPYTNGRGAQKLAQLLELADTYDLSASLRPRDFVAHVRQTPVEEASPARVRVMTIHRAKGLEFDVVVLSELHRKVPSRPPALLVDRPNPAKLIQAVYCYAPESVRALDADLQRVYESQLNEEIRESLCLLYVAMTRPRHALHIYVPPVKESQKPTLTLYHSNILRTALSGSESQDLPGGGKRLHCRGNSNWHLQPHKDFPQTTEQLTDSRQPSLELKSPDAAAHRSFPRVTPSGPERHGRISASDLLAISDTPSQKFGTAIHALFARIRWLEDDTPSDTDLMAAIRKAVPGEHEDWCRSQIGAFRRMLNHAAVQDALSMPRALVNDDIDLWRERFFAVLAGGRMIEGVFDRVVIISKNGAPISATVIDYKTEGVSHETSGAWVSEYRRQMHSYRSALSAMLKIDPSKVQLRLISVTSGYSVEVT